MPMPSSDRRKHASAHRVAIDAALLSAALMLSYLEHLIPFGPLTHFLGFKPGFANIVTVLAFSLLSPLDALAVSLLRVGITGVLFGSWTSLFFSFCGGAWRFSPCSFRGGFCAGAAMSVCRYSALPPITWGSCLPQPSWLRARLRGWR